MATEFKLPNLGEGVDGGDVIDVVVAVGDQVAEGQTLLELETSKATIPVPAPHAGRISQIHVKRGDHVEVGHALVTIDGAGDPSAKPKPEKKEEATKKAASPERSQAETRKEPVPPRHPKKPPTEAKEIGKAGLDAAGEEPVSERPPGPPPEVAQTPEAKQRASATADRLSQQAELVAAGPATRRLARELGVDLRRVHGSGPGGRISTDDVKAYVRQSADERESVQALAAGRAGQPPPLPDFSRWGPVTREPLGSLRRKTAEHVSLAWSLIPQVTHFDEADITELEAFRKRNTERAAAQGVKLTVTAIALKAAAAALKAFPRFNSSLATSGELILKQYYHIGVAVDTERGLIVPVIRDVDRKGVLELARELAGAAERARQRKTTLEELQGGTFTITNLGGIGGTSFSPIVNYPEVAILGLARSRLQQIVRDGQALTRLMLPLCVSYDHRVIDGADAARFTRKVAELLEEPFLILLEG